MTAPISRTEIQGGSEVHLYEDHHLKHSGCIIESGTSGIVISFGNGDEVKVAFEMEKDEDGKTVYDEDGIWVPFGNLCRGRPKKSK
ncbi:hypothetical protein ACFL6I_05455 [candidate division KSB1 bacterium]